SAHFSRPICSSPDAATLAVCATDPASTPLTYSSSRCRCRLYTPTRCVHTPNWTLLPTAQSPAGAAESADGAKKRHSPASPADSENPLRCWASWVTIAPATPGLSGFTQADTAKLCVVLTVFCACR